MKYTEEEKDMKTNIGAIFGITLSIISLGIIGIGLSPAVGGWRLEFMQMTGFFVTILIPGILGWKIGEIIYDKYKTSHKTRNTRLK